MKVKEERSTKKGSREKAEEVKEVLEVKEAVEAKEEAEMKEVAEALAAPFEEAEVRWKPQQVSGSRARVVAFVDARVIQDRLDEVLGVMGWQDSYECLPDGSVMCRLRIRLCGEWIEKMDVGGQSEQPDEGDRRKAAFSDALKRAAVKFGIGRYLYRLEPQWVDYDPQKKRVLGTPRLPADALPMVKPMPATTPATPAEQAMPGTARAGRNGSKTETKPAAATPPVTEAPPAKAESRAARSIPATGEELHRRLHDKDTLLAREGLCKPGDLVKHVAQAGDKAGFGSDLLAWTGPAIQLAIEETRTFESRLRQMRTREVA
jgi:hypothetical protein